MTLGTEGFVGINDRVVHGKCECRFTYTTEDGTDQVSLNLSFMSKVQVNACQKDCTCQFTKSGSGIEKVIMSTELDLELVTID